MVRIKSSIPYQSFKCVLTICLHKVDGFFNKLECLSRMTVCLHKDDGFFNKLQKCLSGVTVCLHKDDWFLNKLFVLL